MAIRFTGYQILKLLREKSPMIARLNDYAHEEAGCLYGSCEDESGNTWYWSIKNDNAKLKIGDYPQEGKGQEIYE